MDVIKITPEDLREVVAQLIKQECRDWLEAGLHAVDSDDRDYAQEKYTKFKTQCLSLVALTDKLEADKREALEFMPAKGGAGMKTLEKLAETDKGIATELRIIRNGSRAAGIMGYLSAMMWREEITEREYVSLCDQAINMAVGLGVQS